MLKLPLGGEFMPQELKLQCLTYEEDGVYVSLCKELNISSFGDTEEEARKNLLNALNLYIEYAIEENKFEELILNKINSHHPKIKVKHAQPFRSILDVRQGKCVFC